MAEAPDNVPVRIARLHGIWPAVVLVIAVGLVILVCAVGVTTALLMADLVECGWRPPPDDSGPTVIRMLRDLVLTLRHLHAG